MTVCSSWTERLIQIDMHRKWGKLFHVQKWQRMRMNDDYKGRVIWFCSFYFSLLLRVELLSFSFLLVSSYYLLLLIPVELCKYSRTSWRRYGNVHARSLNMCQLFPSLGLKLFFFSFRAQSLQELAQWVFEFKKKKKSHWESSWPNNKTFTGSPWKWIIKHFTGYCTHTNTHLTLTEKKMSLFSGSHQHGHTRSLYMYWKYKSYSVLIPSPTKSNRQIAQTPPNVRSKCIWQKCFINENPHCHLLYWNRSQ